MSSKSLTTADITNANPQHQTQRSPNFSPPLACVTSVELRPLPFEEVAYITSLDTRQALATTDLTPQRHQLGDMWQLLTITDCTLLMSSAWTHGSFQPPLFEPLADITKETLGSFQ